MKTMELHFLLSYSVLPFQPMLCPLPQTALTSLSVNPSCALPGDALNSVVDTSFTESTVALSPKELSSVSYLQLLYKHVTQ